MSEDPIKDIRIAEENKKKSLAKREEQKNVKIKKVRTEEELKLQEKKEELLEETKKEIMEAKTKEADRLKNELAEEKDRIEKFVEKIRNSGKLEKAESEILEAFLSAK